MVDSQLVYFLRHAGFLLNLLLILAAPNIRQLLVFPPPLGVGMKNSSNPHYRLFKLTLPQPCPTAQLLDVTLVLRPILLKLQSLCLKYILILSDPLLHIDFVIPLIYDI
jgi:hypothetical protein